jgi:CO/xanthine dehydrogenase FAD-binding subunit
VVGVDLNTVAEICGADEAGPWRPGDAWLAGGTWLFSEPQPHLTRLRDLAGTGWPSLQVADRGLEIAATCTIAELSRFVPPARWPGAAALITQCCRSFVASFKVWNVATVGGNLCNALPAGPMTSLTAALDGTCLLLAPDGSRREIPVTDLVVGDNTTSLSDGELVRSVTLPDAALRDVTAFRQASLYPVGRSAALLIGRLHEGSLVLTVTASVARPLVLRFTGVPDAATLRESVEAAVPAWFCDVHGTPEWRRHRTVSLAEEIRSELEAVR